MNLIPQHIQEVIILNSIILKKNDIGWENIHYQLKNSKTFLKRTDYVFEYGFEFEMAKRIPRICLNDIFSMDENGGYLDDLSDEISYW